MNEIDIMTLRISVEPAPFINVFSPSSRVLLPGIWVCRGRRGRREDCSADLPIHSDLLDLHLAQEYRLMAVA
jgi:hypothetical protein